MYKLILLNLFFYFSWAYNFCGHNQFQCLNGQCVYESRVCDSRADCLDFSDERNCGDYSWCEFNQSELCGWHSTNLTYSCLGSNCALAQRIEAGKSGKSNFNLVIHKMRSFSKTCIIQADLYLANLDNSVCKLNISSHSANKTKQHASYSYDRTNPGYCNGAGCTKTIEVDIGYVKKNSRLSLNGSIERSPSYAAPLVFGIKNIKYLNCNPALISKNCDFNNNSKCNWVDDDKFIGSWKWNKTGYLYNDKPSLAEIRSPLINHHHKNITTYCLAFEYFNNSTENALHVTKNNLETDGSQHLLWSSRNTTGNYWSHAKLEIQTNIDIDIGLISVAAEGVVAVDNVTIADGACGSTFPITKRLF